MKIKCKREKEKLESKLKNEIENHDLLKVEYKSMKVSFERKEEK